MQTSIFDSFFADSLFPPMRTIYIVSDSKLEELNRKQREEELANLETSRKRLDENYKSRIKILDERKQELQEELNALSPAKKEVIKSK